MSTAALPMSEGPLKCPLTGGMSETRLARTSYLEMTLPRASVGTYVISQRIAVIGAQTVHLGGVVQLGLALQARRIEAKLHFMRDRVVGGAHANGLARKEPELLSRRIPTWREIVRTGTRLPRGNLIADRIRMRAAAPGEDLEQRVFGLAVARKCGRAQRNEPRGIIPAPSSPSRHCSEVG